MGVFATHIDDILGCGLRGISERARRFSEQRFGPLKLQESEVARDGMELSKGGGSSFRLIQSASTEGLMPLDTSPTLWANRQKPLGGEEKLLRQ